mmetsp:Transcript_67619/g.179914  ORF Transcript_67619/g.179914 Transcript_67619/m.179914 type:complete len:267 (+) Transcript_67619:299-1099(+)
MPRHHSAPVPNRPPTIFVGAHGRSGSAQPRLQPAAAHAVRFLGLASPLERRRRARRGHQAARLRQQPGVALDAVEARVDLGERRPRVLSTVDLGWARLAGDADRPRARVRAEQQPSLPVGVRVAQQRVDGLIAALGVALDRVDQQDHTILRQRRRLHVGHRWPHKDQDLRWRHLGLLRGPAETARLGPLVELRQRAHDARPQCATTPVSLGELHGSRIRKDDDARLLIALEHFDDEVGELTLGALLRCLWNQRVRTAEHLLARGAE